MNYDKFSTTCCLLGIMGTTRMISSDQHRPPKETIWER